MSRHTIICNAVVHNKVDVLHELFSGNVFMLAHILKGENMLDGSK